MQRLPRPLLSAGDHFIAFLQARQHFAMYTIGDADDHITCDELAVRALDHHRALALTHCAVLALTTKAATAESTAATTLGSTLFTHAVGTAPSAQVWVDCRH